ncbi:MAG TPA: excisionase family DNA-binding protein [Actinomycetales bacterium]|jgi:excisionase family DNA binding protein|nr:excisionase family DNA-binding protein [Mycobacteriales bacterium]HEX5535540.1 excisionase family DNA-binding protein [Actinomycetales bacterium]
MRLLTIPEAATELHVPEGWLRKKVTAREVPFTRLGKHVRFTDDQLRAIVIAGEVLPIVVPARQGLSRRARKLA